jgi:hypothetical protein
MDKKSVTVSTAIFGSSDGLVASIALILATMTHGQKVVLAAVLGLLIAEGLGMAASEYLADPKRDLRQSLIMGAATSFAIILPGLPWTATSGAAAALLSCLIAVILAGLIAWARSGGWTAWAQTYGILIGVSAIATVAGHFT